MLIVGFLFANMLCALAHYGEKQPHSAMENFFAYFLSKESMAPWKVSLLTFLPKISCGHRCP